MTLCVAIIGRPNVGKSSLFNRLCGRRLALVDDRPGVTRDRREGEGRLAELKFQIIDTAGLDEAADGTLEARMYRQTETAIAMAGLCLFMIDARAGVTPVDEHFARMLLRQGKPVILLANKAEGGAGQAGYLEAFSLGLGEPIAFSAAHGEGLTELYEELLPYFAGSDIDAGEDGEELDDDGLDDIDTSRPLRLAIVGRPNAGKSTLINRMIGEERLLTGPEAGITRDAISVDYVYNDRAIKLWDTAGMRKRARVSGKLEKLSVADGLRAVKFAEVVVVMMDATIPLERQDLAIAGLVAREGRALVIVMNKWDLVKDKAGASRELNLEVERLLPEVSGVPMVMLSAKTGKGLHKLMPAVMDIYQTWNRRIPTAALNKWLEFQTRRHPPPAPGGRRIKMRYMTQVRTRPPTFSVFSQRADDVPESYKRYLINSMREDFEMWGIPARINMRKGKNPFA